MLRYAENGERIGQQVIDHSAVDKRPFTKGMKKVSWFLKGQKTRYHENICKILQSRLLVH